MKSDKDREQAIKDWNTRTLTPSDIEAVRGALEYYRGMRFMADDKPAIEALAILGKVKRSK